MISQLGNFIGRFHPLAVHLPIGILLVLAVLEVSTVLSRRPRFSRWPALGEGPRGLILGCAAVAALAAAAMGWLLARSGGYDPMLVHRHRNLGLIVAALSLVLFGLHRLCSGRSSARGTRLRQSFGGQAARSTYAAWLALTIAALTAAGHTGGTLSHGPGYLTEYWPWAPKSAAIDPRHEPAFTGLIQPILIERCSSCHGPAKTNGELRMDTWEALIKGGKHGAVFKPGDSPGSPMVQRTSLPLEEKAHMPPRGKPQLREDELALLAWWIDAGAPQQTPLADLNAPPDIAQALAGRFGLPFWGEPPPDRAVMVAAAAALAAKLGIVIRPLARSAPWLAVNARVQGRRFGDAELAQLAPIGPAVQRLDAGETAVTDAGLAGLARMKNLQRLDLDRTAVTDAGLARLAPLANLSYLNLYATGVTDAGLPSLRPLASLRSLYLWKTKVTAAAADALAARLTDTRKLERWEAQASDLQNRIRGEKFYYNLGAGN